MELPSLGQQCSELNCKQLDFLPLKCKCGMIFCSDHFSKHSENCPAVQVHNAPVLENTEAEYVCSFPFCKIKSYVPLLCPKCNKHLCVAHRHITECEEKDPKVIAAEIEKFSAPVKEFNDAKKEVDKQLDATLNQARKKAKTQQMANKVQLMRIKNRATGLKTIPSTDRIYFNVQHPKSTGNKVSPVFVSKTWTLGRTIDGIAEECKIVNRNNQNNAPKLRLFYKSGELLSTNLSGKMETFLSEQTIIDGQDILLEYVDNDCTHFNIS